MADGGNPIDKIVLACSVPFTSEHVQLGFPWEV